MTFITCLLLVYQQNWSMDARVIPLTLPSRQLSVEWAGGALTEKGHFLAHSKDTLYHWRTDGSLICVVTAGQLEIRSFYEEDGHYLVSGHLIKKNQVNEDDPACILFRGDQELARYPELYTPFFIKVKEHLFSLNREMNGFATRNNLRGDYYPFMVKSHQLELGPVPKVTPNNYELVKVNQRLLDMLLNFKKIWIVHRQNRFLVVNQIEPRVYLYDQAAISQEYTDGILRESATPFAGLDLHEYSGVPAMFWHPTRVMREQEAKESFEKWWKELGLTVYFGQLGSGFVFAYQIPSDQKEQVIGIQALDRHFKSVGPLLKVNGLVLGSHHHQVYVLQGTPDASEVHSYTFNSAWEVPELP